MDQLVFEAKQLLKYGYAVVIKCFVLRTGNDVVIFGGVLWHAYQVSGRFVVKGVWKQEQLTINLRRTGFGL